jgi:DNA-binding LacI/PurR family transcriptional regulator
MDRAAMQGYHLSVSASRTADGERLFYDSLFNSRRVDGLIILESMEHDERIDRLRSNDFPFVLIGRYDGSRDIFTVNNDNVGGAEMAVRYLLQRGRRRIGYINGPANLTVCQDRLLGYRRALEAAGVAFDPCLVAETDFGEQGGRDATLRLLKHAPDAILALDDLIGLGALATLKQEGRRVPEFVALVGFNDSVFCPHTDPPLTSVRVNVQEIGERAADLLIARIEDSVLAPCQVLVPCEIVERASS